MTHKNILPSASIALFVKNIQVFTEKKRTPQVVLPFYADGYPGLMFQDSADGLFVRPHEKKMPAFFLYGQTIKPIELVVDGPFQLIVFQLYPFVLKSFFGIRPRDVNDSCYDVCNVQNLNTASLVNQLQQQSGITNRVRLMMDLLQQLFTIQVDQLDFKVRQAIILITGNNGQSTVTDLCSKLKITERTFERRFIEQVGVSPKQFSKIIQFSGSLTQLGAGEHSKLTDIVYANGFADQSHFIRVFKTFTGKTPKKFTGAR